MLFIPAFFYFIKKVRNLSVLKSPKAKKLSVLGPDLTYESVYLI